MATITVLERIRKLVVAQFGLTYEDVRDDASLQLDYNAHDLDIIELVVALEDEFCIKICENSVDAFDSIRKIEKVLTENGCHNII